MEEPDAPEPNAPEAEPADVRPTPRWGLGDAILGLAVGVVLSSVLAGIWLGITGDDELNIPGQAFSQVGLWIGFVGSAVLATRRKGSGSLTVDFHWAFRRVDLLLGVAAAAVAMLVVVPGVTFLLGPLLGDPEVSGPVQDLVEKAHGPGIVGLVLVAAVGAPLVEELFFRGLLLRSIEKRLGAAWAIAGSSVLFGLAHPNELPWKGQVMVMAALAALAVVMAVLTVRTGRLGAAIVAHAVFNGVNLIVAFNT